MDVLLRGTVYRMEPGDTSAFMAQEQPVAPKPKSSEAGGIAYIVAVPIVLALVLFFIVIPIYNVRWRK